MPGTFLSYQLPNYKAGRKSSMPPRQRHPHRVRTSPHRWTHRTSDTPISARPAPFAISSPSVDHQTRHSRLRSTTSTAVESSTWEQSMRKMRDTKQHTTIAVISSRDRTSTSPATRVTRPYCRLCAIRGEGLIYPWMRGPPGWRAPHGRDALQVGSDYGPASTSTNCCWVFPLFILNVIV
jgi:hypothetical protein